MARQKITPDPTCLLEAHEVTMKFTRYDVGVNSLKELVVRAFRRDLKREKFTCLENVSFKIRKGEAVAVIGRNGVGKSTLLKIVSGILKPTSGWAHCNGRISPLLQLGAGFDGNATGIENIYLNAAIMGYTKKEIDAKLPDILAFAELGDLSIPRQGVLFGYAGAARLFHRDHDGGGDHAHRRDPRRGRHRLPEEVLRPPRPNCANRG